MSKKMSPPTDVLDMRGKVITTLKRLLLVASAGAHGRLLRGLGEASAPLLDLHAFYRLPLAGDGLVRIAITDLDRVERNRFIYHFTVSQVTPEADGAVTG